MEFNEKIIQARKNKGLSQEALAECVGVSRQAVSKWETGEAKPDVEKLISLCQALDLSMDQLCLNKAQESIVHVPELSGSHRQDGLRKGMIIGVVTGILLSVLSMCIVSACIGSDDPAEPAVPTSGQTETTPDYSHMMSQLDMANVIAEVKWREEGYKVLEIAVFPNMDIPGMTVQIQVENQQNGNTKLYTAEKIRGAYRMELETGASCDWELMAVFTLGDITVNHSLCRVLVGENNCTVEPYWKLN